MLLRIYGQILYENPETVVTDSVISGLLAEKKLGPKLYGIFTGSTLLRLNMKQECIPVGCVPPAAVAVGGRGALDQIPFNFPLGCGPGRDPPQFPPWVWAWT